MHYSILNQLIIKYFLHSKINKESKELTEHFDNQRYLNKDCNIEIDPIKNEIIRNEKSSYLFYSLSLVDPEKSYVAFHVKFKLF